MKDLTMITKVETTWFPQINFIGNILEVDDAWEPYVGEHITLAQSRGLFSTYTLCAVGSRSQGWTFYWIDNANGDTYGVSETNDIYLMIIILIIIILIIFLVRRKK
jgi:hypothetical protein